jgi:hypothetical protein
LNSNKNTNRKILDSNECVIINCLVAVKKIFYSTCTVTWNPKLAKLMVSAALANIKSVSHPNKWLPHVERTIFIYECAKYKKTHIVFFYAKQE